LIKELSFVGGHIGIWVLALHVLIRLWAPLTDTAGTTTPLTAFDERGITYLVDTNARWLPYLADEGICFVQYFANRVRRQFGLDQDILDDFSATLESATFVRPILRLIAFEFLSKHFTTVTIPSSQ